MKIKKTIRRYCKYCGHHTEHKVSQVSTGHKRGTLKWGSIDRHKKRGIGAGFGNKGRWGSKPTKTKRGGAKASKKTNTKYTCQTCKKSIIQKQGIRSKKIEME